MATSPWVQALTSWAWFLYQWLLAVFVIRSVASALEGHHSPTAVQLMDWAVAVVAIVGVFGYFARLPLLRPGFWRVFLPVLLVLDLYYYLTHWPAGPLAGDLPIELALLAPMYTALFLYAYRSGAVWAREAEPRSLIPPLDKTNKEKWQNIALYGAILAWLPAWNFLESNYLPNIGLGLLVILSVAAALVVAVPVNLLLLHFIARSRPQDFFRDCVACGHTMPVLRWPRSLGEALWGGWTCRACGSKQDRHGRLRL